VRDESRANKLKIKMQKAKIQSKNKKYQEIAVACESPF
jgi:hypothetical protein